MQVSPQTCCSPPPSSHHIIDDPTVRKCQNPIALQGNVFIMRNDKHGLVQLLIGFPHHLTHAECDHITDFIGSLSKMNAPFDGALQTIVDEEIKACLVGNQSGEDTADNIQSRVEILLSEKS